jgi:PIN domain nuclease of toxin-antitoxin system
MTIVLDTHVIIWDALDQKQLSKLVIETVEKADNENSLLISDISLWEISMLIDKERLKIDAEILEFLEALINLRSFTIVPIDHEIAAKSVQFLQVIQSDPADSIIVATAFCKNAILVSADKKIRNSKLVETIW